MGALARFPERQIRVAVLVFGTAAAIAAIWWWLGRPLALPAGAAGPGPIQCMSYAPFRADQSPLVETTRVEPFEIEEDLRKLARLTGCVRTYSVQNGLDAVPAIASRIGLKVLQGLWLGSDRQKNRREIEHTVALARQFPNAIEAIVVGNEVLLRGELSAEEIASVLAEVKAASGMPVTYADVWEFWLRNRELARSVDFVTVHILPYWEDFPIAAVEAGAHVDAIRARVAANFPGKDILIGEVGWPSAGRMREGALPSPSNQARVLADVMARAHAKNYRVNLIEAFDQPWKRQFEGTVGGYWGLFSSRGREPKFAWGEPVSDHPAWAWQLALGLVMAGVVFGAASFPAQTRGRMEAAPTASSPALAAAVAATKWRPPGAEGESSHLPACPSLATRYREGGVLALFPLAIIALTAGVAVPWSFANAVTDSLGVGGWIRGMALVAIAVAAPIAAALALAAGIKVPAFSRILGRAPAPQGALDFMCGAVLMATSVLAIQTALGLVFDPRYRDFACAEFTGAVVPFAVTAAAGGRRKGTRGTAETVAAATLAGSAVYIALNEGFANWQALWLAATLILLALTLWRLRDGQST